MHQLPNVPQGTSALVVRTHPLRQNTFVLGAITVWRDLMPRPSVPMEHTNIMKERTIVMSVLLDITVMQCQVKNKKSQC